MEYGRWEDKERKEVRMEKEDNEGLKEENKKLG